MPDCIYLADINFKYFLFYELVFWGRQKGIPIKFMPISQQLREAVFNDIRLVHNNDRQYFFAMKYLN